MSAELNMMNSVARDAVVNKFCTVFFRYYLILIILGNGSRIKGFSLDNSDFTVLTAFKYPKTRLRHYEWRYFRVELPSGFSIVSMALTTNWGNRDLIGLSNNTTPLVCFRAGGPPLPGSGVESDLVEAISVGRIHNISNMGQCVLFWKSMSLNLTSEQVSSGVHYFGFFNGAGPIRTQSKMISRGSAYTFGLEITVFGCKSSFLVGPYCNNTINSLSCLQFSLYEHPRQLYENPLNGRKHQHVDDSYHVGTANVQQLSSPTERNCLLKCNERVIWGNNERASISEDRSNTEKKNHSLGSARHALRCTNSFGRECIKDGEWKFYSLQIVDITSQLDIMVEYESFNLSASTNGNTHDDSQEFISQGDVQAMLYVRHNALPQKTLYDYLLPVGQSNLSIRFPKLGLWYIGVYFKNLTKARSQNQNEEKEKISLCFVLKWRIYACIPGKAGDGCEWQGHMLQRVIQVGAHLPFESHYLPINREASAKSQWFPLEPFVSNSSIPEANEAWTFFIFEVPHGAAGGVISVELKSYAAKYFEMYARYGGLPTIHIWDYYTNISHTGENSVFMIVKDIKRQTNLYLNIIYPREGVWCLGLRHPVNLSLKLDNRQVTMHVSLQGCPIHCSKHGTCRHAFEESGISLFSYCSCDRTHGGFDCSMELVSPKGHKRQSAALIASNVAAILPGLWSIHHKAYAEWILYTTSGISSALYHSCDVGSWCALSFHVLQFMDFWLSFMAVVATFIYMASIDENMKVAIYTIAAVITALIAANGPTRSINIIIVIIIGTLGLLSGWMVEFFRANQIAAWHPCFNSTISERWEALKRESLNLIQKVRRRFRWHFMWMGFLALGASSLSWHFETAETYWFWHSLWHISIYSSSFFFLCSTSQRHAITQSFHRNYELVPCDIMNNSNDSLRQAESAAFGEDRQLHV